MITFKDHYHPAICAQGKVADGFHNKKQETIGQKKIITYMSVFVVCMGRTRRPSIGSNFLMILFQ